MNIYISATLRDLTTERMLVGKLISGLGLRPQMSEDFIVGRDINPFQLCRDEVNKADVFIGIYAHSYGGIPQDLYDSETNPSGISYIHHEYLWAKERGIPMLLFFLAENPATQDDAYHASKPRETEPERIAKFHAFKEEVLKTQLVTFFHSFDDLKRKVGGALTRVVHRHMFTMKEQQEIVFISHSTLDDAFVTQLAHKLSACGLCPWVDHMHILPGADWDIALESALNAADALIIALSPEATWSIVVKAEWSYFAEMGKKIYPLLWRTTEVPFRLRVLQYVDFMTAPEAGFARLKEALGVPNCGETWE